MTSKEKILNAIKANNVVKDVKLPSYDNFGIKISENKMNIFEVKDGCPLKGKTDQMTEEELRLEEERIEKERKERDLIGKYYGASAQKAGRFTSRAKAVVLTQEELDDDALIALIEDNPTYNRDPKIVARARSKVAGEDIQVSAPTTAKQPANQPRQDSQRGGKQVISFR